MVTVYIVCGGNELGGEDRDWSTRVCTTRPIAERVSDEMEEEYDFVDIFEQTIVDE